MYTLESSQTQVIYHALIAVFGAFVHALESQRKGGTKSFTDFLALVIMSSFSGVMFALVGLQFFPEQIYLTTSLAGRFYDAFTAVADANITKSPITPENIQFSNLQLNF